MLPAAVSHPITAGHPRLRADRPSSTGCSATPTSTSWPPPPSRSGRGIPWHRTGRLSGDLDPAVGPGPDFRRHPRPQCRRAARRQRHARSSRGACCGRAAEARHRRLRAHQQAVPADTATGSTPSNWWPSPTWTRTRASADRRRARRRPTAAASRSCGRADVDVVLNLTIPAAHADIALQAIAAGKSVYGEKPLALDTARGAAGAERRRGRRCRVGCAPDTVLGTGIQTARKADRRRPDRRADRGDRDDGRPPGTNAGTPTRTSTTSPAAARCSTWARTTSRALVTLLGPVTAVIGGRQPHPRQPHHRLRRRARARPSRSTSTPTSPGCWSTPPGCSPRC